ncbi:hypothetical protein SAMN05421805_102402 [Saccharopolyspora antimicrobica]|uniref:Uncharacterized protein n=1 Tax=Saccharopolyspora antimicrobica TaxID=455193 RepID=A0A1I4VVN3_9PSEU|nr:hypothetical protein [Saccharopolyspora antimicrobica]SFN05250.1 hypothetical protein SAMN05421805_102402 [Saccharopolyspora antimicrobica]
MMLGTLTIAIGGALGGHLSYAQGAGVRRWQNPDERDSLSDGDDHPA